MNNVKYLSPKQVFNIWRSFEQHFKTEKFNIATGARVRAVSDQTFAARRDVKQFGMLKVQNTLEFAELYLSYIDSNKGKRPYIIDLVQYVHESQYLKKWKHKLLNLDKTVQDDIAALSTKGSFNHIWFGSMEQQPIAYQMYESGKISLETLVLANEVLGIFDNWDLYIKPTVIWNQRKLFVRKYSCFINKNTECFVEYCKMYFSDYE